MSSSHTLARDAGAHSYFPEPPSKPAQLGTWSSAVAAEQRPPALGARDDGASTGVGTDTAALEDVRRAMKELAIERADVATFGAATALVLFAAAGGIAVWMVEHDLMSVIAGTLFFAAALMLARTRRRLHAELTLVGEAHGLSRAVARKEADALIDRMMRAW